MENIILNTWDSLRISLDKTNAELRSMQMTSFHVNNKETIDIYIRKCPKFSPLNLGEVSHALYLLIFP